ncbi:MAG: enoyl-CoA hydratase/isomerase family protein [Dehalococcoidia bacterium]|nr:enoyl-CoA hydratase/isomerase family protein [Dehalococcoidia bacterium]
MGQFVTLERPREGVALVTMSNPAINNHGSWEGIAELAATMKDARETGARVTVLASGVPGHWFEHAWLQDLADGIEGKPTTAPGRAWYDALFEIGKTDVVTIAAVSGDCSGGGAELGWACDLRIAEEQALFAQPEVQIALTTGIGGTSRVARIIGRTATAELVMLGRPMTARRVYELGGVNEVVPAGKAVEVALAWAAELASRPAMALAALKQILVANDDLSLADALANEQRVFQGVATTPEAIATMRAIQARFDAGESIRSVYGGPRG